jgi:hypothetical protein
MPVGLRDRRRISQKLPSLQRRPKRLKQLSNRLFENRIVINTLPESSGVATTARTRGSAIGWPISVLTAVGDRQLRLVEVARRSGSGIDRLDPLVAG